MIFLDLRILYFNQDKTIERTLNLFLADCEISFDLRIELFTCLNIFLPTILMKNLNCTNFDCEKHLQV